MKEKKLFLIDGTALIYRSYFAFIRNPLYNSKGENTSAIFGVINSFLKLLENYDPRYIAISFDRKEKTFRHKIDETYKANRPPAPEELIAQTEPIKEFFYKIGIADISKAGFEADDVLATISAKYKNEFDIVIVSGDKDFAQLVDDKVTLFDPKKEKHFDREKIKKKYGINPEQFIDYLALCGDSADNIPGVKGIGPKTATKLLSQFGSLKGIYEHIDEISASGIKNKLQQNQAEAFLSQELVTIIQNVPLNLDSINFQFQKENLQKSIPLLQRYELNSIIKKISKGKTIQNEEKKAKDKIEFEAVLLDEKEKFLKMLKALQKFDLVALDTETTDTDPQKADLVGISLCFQKNNAFYIPIAHSLENNLDKEFVLENLRKICSDKIFVGHNIKYDLIVLERAGWRIDNEIFDTMIAHYLLYPTYQHGLAKCAREEFDYEMQSITDLIGKGKKQITFDLVPTKKAANYSAEDAALTFWLYHNYQHKLQENNVADLFQKIEMPMVYVLKNMENNGVFIDENILKNISERNQLRIGELTKKIYEIAGSQFNLNSTQQLSKVLFDDLNIKPIKKTKTGYSTNINVLEKLAEDHKIARLLIEYRQLTKLESTYVKALPGMINPRTGRIHSSFNQTIASTGRLSSSNPNLQNIPIRSDLGKEIRNAFCPQKENRLILAADYSQIELRILAMLSGDDQMIKAFQEKKDIHRETASIIYDLPQNKITADQRRYAKIINFGLMYGMGAFRISNELNISRSEAQKFIENYFSKFPTIKEYLRSSIAKAQETGFVSTIFGRKLFLPDLRSKNKRKAKAAERIAVNMPIQGSAADIIKIAMIKLHKELKPRSDIKMIIQVHDELVFEIEESVKDEAIKLIRNKMIDVLPEKYQNIIFMEVDIGFGKNWFEAH